MARSASALLQTSKMLSIQMASSGVSDKSDSELQFADKDESDSQHSKAYYHEPSSTVTNLKPQPSKKKRSKLVEACQEIEVMGSTTNLVYSADGSINLKAQNTQIQQVLKTAIFELKKASIFNNVFPNITQKCKMALNAVYNAARKHQEYVISKRIKHDFNYVVALAGVLEGQLSSFHTNLKKLTHQIVVSHFGLKKGCGDKVDDLIRSHKYIFPTDAKSCEDFVLVLNRNNEPKLPIAMAHQATLTHIFNGSQKKYHVLMTHLYKAVSAVESSEPTGSLDTCNYLDLDAMGED
ncbi:hypothetical protein BDR06DRAFT_976242 [Suillus hirtellus]|nr:hypothetical protein BDR06DRAFT_976242 [Suillus hirtellus]